MGEQESRRPKNRIAAAMQDEVVQRATAHQQFVDLSAVPKWTRNMTEPQFTIKWSSNVGITSVRGAQEIKDAAQGRPELPTTSPPSLAIVRDEKDSTKLYGVPTAAKSDSFLALEWIDQNRRARANFMALLRSLKIEIPEGTRMVIKVSQTDHAEWGSVVQLHWDSDCFEPVNSQGAQVGEDEGQEAEEE